MKHHLLTSLCVMACSSLQVVNAQQIAVAGKVSDQNGASIAGVTVTVKGTSISTSTNENGLFTLNADHNATLIISAIGYQRQEIPLAGRKTININLTSADEAIDEVIVVAYGTAKKSAFTGSATQVDFDKEGGDVPVNSFEQALVGKLPGVQINTTTGQAGATSSIQVRGIGSMNAGTEPLYVVGGIPAHSGKSGQIQSALAGTSHNIMATNKPNDIESITVLKDATASSLY